MRSPSPHIDEASLTGIPAADAATASDTGPTIERYRALATQPRVLVALSLPANAGPPRAIDDALASAARRGGAELLDTTELTALCRAIRAR